VGELYLTDIGVPEAVYRAVGVDRGQIFVQGPIVRAEVRDRDWHVIPGSEEIEV
jgi:hypothetical protein